MTVPALVTFLLVLRMDEPRRPLVALGVALLWLIPFVAALVLTGVGYVSVALLVGVTGIVGTLRPARDGRRVLFRREWLDAYVEGTAARSLEAAA